MNKTYLRKGVISAFLIIALIVNFAFADIKMLFVDAATNNTWIIDDYYDNEYLEVFNIDQEEGLIVLRGTHNKKTNENYYKTDGFILTTEKYNTSGNFPSSAKNNRIYAVVDPESDNGTTIKTLYTLRFNDIVGMAGKLGMTGESIGNGTVPIYLHVVYDIYKGDKRVVNDVIGVQEMLKAPIKYRLGYTEWGPGTQTKIPSYYNMRFDLSVKSTYNIKVVAVDQQKNVIKDNLDPVKKVIYRETYSYQLPDQEKTISAGGTSYKYTDKWHYVYTDRKTGNILEMPSKTGPVAYLNEVPDALPGSTLTIKMEYDVVKTDPYWVEVIAVDNKGNKLQDLKSKVKTTAGTQFNYSIPETQKTLKGTYNYQNKWYLTYTQRDPEAKKTINGNTEKINNYVMPDAKKDSVATFHMVYEPGPTPTPLPVTPTPTPSIPEVVAPEPDSVSLPFTNVVTTGVIQADNRSSMRFQAIKGVPTTESLYGEVIAKNYLLGYSFVKKVGIKNYVIEVSKDYILNWETATPESAGGGEPLTETITVKHHVTVPRAYGYWEIENLECYKIDNAELRNFALPDGSITIRPNYTYYNPPSVTVRHSGQEDDHIIPPQEKAVGINLPSQTISDPNDPTRKPPVPMEEFISEANYTALTQTGKIKVKSDYLNFNGSTVISDQVVETEAPDINTSAIPQCETFTDNNVLYKPGQIIEAKKKNGTYGSNGTITYSSIATVNPSKQHYIYYPINGINNVVIHTPVVCKPIIASDNDQYVQLLSPSDNCVQLVLDPDSNLSDFEVNISNNGPHSNKLGYYTRDISRSLRDPDISYIASKEGILRNEVKFSFDVYMDIGKDKDPENDKYVKAGTWVVIG
ncbi:hypothetical protein I5677_16770, partial [Mobilitalea sibirica]